MKVRELLRAKKKQKIDDADADKTPFASGDLPQHKQQDKQRTLELGLYIAELQNLFYAEHSRKLLVILQGMDTAGKDRTIGSVFGQVNPMGVRAVGFKAPTYQELGHDYLWRAHQETPTVGQIVIFNRSHYEDVLISRVHKLIDDKECKRRFAQIRDFERMLSETGTVIVKIFLNISKDQQKQRLEERLNDPQKQWKFDPQDIEERKNWDDYQQAYEQAIIETDADHAPWYIVPANSKTHRNLAVASLMVEIMESLKLDYPPVRPDLFNLKII